MKVTSQYANLWTSEAVVSHRDNGESFLLCEEQPPQETFTASRGELYRFCVSEYGRCVGKVYIDAQGGPRPVGWVFQARRPYEDDASRTSLIETWVTVRDEHGSYA